MFTSKPKRQPESFSIPEPKDRGQEYDRKFGFMLVLGIITFEKYCEVRRYYVLKNGASDMDSSITIS